MHQDAVVARPAHLRYVTYLDAKNKIRPTPTSTGHQSPGHSTRLEGRLNLSS